MSLTSRMIDQHPLANGETISIHERVDVNRPTFNSDFNRPQVRIVWVITHEYDGQQDEWRTFDSLNHSYMNVAEAFDHYANQFQGGPE